MIYNCNSTSDQRPGMLAWVKAQNFESVIDIGPAWNPWTKDVITACIDMENISLPGVLTFKGNINDPDGWMEVENYIAEHGKFKFSICTHVLEDVCNPAYVVKQLQKVSEQGFIAMPSKHWELGFHVECWQDSQTREWGLTSPWRGFFHHRWIFDMKGGTLWAFPKLGFVEKLDCFGWVKGREAWHEMTFWWKDDIPYKVINDDYLGPNGPAVCQYYREHLTE